MDSLDHPTRSALRRLARDLGRRKAEAQKARYVGAMSAPIPTITFDVLVGDEPPAPAPGVIRLRTDLCRAADAEEIERNDDGSRDRNS